MRLQPDQDQFVDYKILIDSISDPNMVEILRKLHSLSSSQKEPGAETVRPEFENLCSAINGIGRIVQYRNTSSLS